jgi:hypothetical protein
MAAICTGTVHGTDRRLQGPAKSRSAPNARTCLSLESSSRPGPSRSRGTGPRPASLDKWERIATFIVQPLLFRVIGHHVLTVDTPIGRKMRPRLMSHAAPLIRVKPTSPRANPTAIQRPGCRPEQCAPKAHHPARTQVRMHRPARPARPRQLRRPCCDRRRAATGDYAADSTSPAIPGPAGRARETLPTHGRRQLILRKALPPAERGSRAPSRPGHISMI